MDDSALRDMIMAGIFFTAMIGLGIWQVLRLLSRPLDGLALVRLTASMVILGIMCWVGFTMLKLWVV